jgi:prevent-host-death family protein
MEKLDRISTSRARRQFADTVKRAARDGRRVKITHYGKTLVGLVPARDLEVLRECEERSKADGARSRRAARR